MRRTSSLLAGLAAMSLVLAPSLALAKAGAGSSMGSRGSRTYSAPPSTNTAPSTAAPMDRTMAPRAPAGAPAGAPMGAPARSGGFMSGLAGGLLGVGIGSMLFGGGMFGGSGGFGLMGMLSLLIQGALLFFVARWLFRRFAGGGQPAMAGGAPRMAQGATGPAPMMMQGAAVGGAAAAVTVSKADYEAFEQVLQGVQAAWSAGDMAGLRRVATPEMAGYFAEQQTDLASKGLSNSISHVKLEQGDLSEAWAENGRDWATVAMRFSALDVTKDASGRVVEGDLALRTMTTELWTFVRARGGSWILSAIQQAR